MMPPVPPGSALVLAGPTASGKTAAAHLLAREAGLEILSADSMLVYRGMDIGTAKPEPPLRAEVRYWGLDLVGPGAPFSLALYLEEAAKAKAENGRRGRGLVVAGGTGLYIKALAEGLDEGPPPDPALRAAWEGRVAAEGVGPLQRELEERHPEVWNSLTEPDRRNPRRLVRALELGAAGCRSVKRGWTAERARPVIPVLRLPAPLLRARIEKRVRLMYAAGLLDEVQGLRAALEAAPTASGAIGYAEALRCLEGRLTVQAAQEETVRRTWQLARRQMTWFRHQAAVRWIDVESELPPEAVAERVRRAWVETGPLILA